MNNLSVKILNKVLNKTKLLEKRTPSKGCLMLDVDFPEVKELQKQIKKEDLYTQEGENSFGLERDSHITLLYGFDKSVTVDQLKDIINEFDFPKEIKTKSISLFENEYDVLKFDIDDSFLKKVNKALKVLPYKNDYPDFHPHLTVAYLKKGKGKDYIKLFKDKTYSLITTKCLFSSPDKEKTSIKIKLKKSLVEKILNEGLDT